jgi:Transcriptional regulators
MAGQSEGNITYQGSAMASAKSNTSKDDKSQADKLNLPFKLEVDLDRDSATPLHHQISVPLEKLILSGELSAGSLVEDEVSMAQRLKVSRPTARRALQDLVARGLLSRRRGVGTRVTPTHIHRPLGLTSLEDDLKKAGFETKTDVLRYEVILAGEEEAKLLQCEEGSEVVRTKRLRWSDGEPLAIMVNLLPSDSAPSLSDLSRQGLYACLRANGVGLVTAQQTVAARVASAEEAELLEVSMGDPLLTLKRTVYNQAGTVVEYGNHVYDAKRYSLSFTSVAD